jgi:serine/threonine-protein kinase
MEYVEGDTLSDKIRRYPLTTKEALDLVIQVAEALEEVHSCGMVHRDIKPENIVVTRRGRVKLLDFGLAKMVQQPQGDTEKTVGERPVTKAGSMVGTVAYMSPEQATGGTVGPRSDIFSLGSVLYECLTGRRPFCGATAMEVGANVIYANPPSPSDFNRGVPSELNRIVLKMLAKNPKARYQSAGKLIEDLRKVDNTLPEDHVLGNRQRSTDLNTTVSTILQKNLRRPFAFPTAFFNRACSRIGQALTLFL